MDTLRPNMGSFGSAEEREQKRTEPITPEELAEQYNAEVADFFEERPKEGVEVLVFDSEEELKDFYRETYPEREQPESMSGFRTGTTAAIVTEGSIIGAGKPFEHVFERIDFEKVLKHEVAHMYMGKTAVWLMEGVCMYLAGQTPNKEDWESEKFGMAELRELHGLTTNPKMYGVGLKMVKAIIGKYGKEKLLELIKIEDEDALYVEIEEMFG